MQEERERKGKANKMRRYRFLAVLTTVVSLIISIPFVTTQVRAYTVTADVDIDPNSLLLKDGGHGKWITVHIKLPDGYEVNNINMSTVVLDLMGYKVLVSKYEIEGDVLMVKFDRGEVINFLWPMIEHMSPRVKQKVTLTVMGNFYNGDIFEGSDLIDVFYTHL